MTDRLIINATQQILPVQLPDHEENRTFPRDSSACLAILGDCIDILNNRLILAGLSVQFNPQKLWSLINNSIDTNEQKKLTFCLNSQNQLVVAILHNGGVKLREVIGFIDCPNAGGSDNKQQVKAIRKAFVEFVISSLVAGSIETPAAQRGEMSLKVEKMINEGVFTDPLATLQQSKQVENLLKQIIDSGVFLYYPELSTSLGHGAESLKLFLSGLDAESLIKIAGQIDQRNGSLVTEPDSAQQPQESSSRNLEKTVKTSQGLVAPFLPISPDIRIASVKGISCLLELSQKVEQGRVRVLDSESATEERAFVTYGTTDFANPVEAIMTASVRGNEQLYIADDTAHSVGSYLSRILIPSFVSMDGLSVDQARQLYSAVGELQALGDASIVELETKFAGTALSGYFTRLKEKMGIHNEQTTFKELYRELNKAQAKILGITYQSGTEFLQEFKFPLSDLLKMAESIAEKAESATMAIRAYIEEIIPTLAEKDLNDFMNMIVGKSGSWSAGNRVLIKDKNGTDLDINSLNSNTPLCDLLEQGYKFGGNAWGIIDNLLALQRQEKVTVAHKNTKQGGNYAMLLLGASAEQLDYTLTPIVRVVPAANNEAKTGDGLDIGWYLQYPQLYSLVRQYLVLPANSQQAWIGSVLGGKSQIVIEVGKEEVPVKGQLQQPVVASVYVQSVEGGKKQLLEQLILGSQNQES